MPSAPTSQEALNALLRDILPPQGAWSEAAYRWLTDHSNRLIEFTEGLTLRDGAYVEHGVYGRGATARSPLLPGLAADVAACFDAPTVGA